MEEKAKTPLSIRALYVIIEIVYVISILVCGLGGVLCILIFTGVIGQDLQLHVDMPVAVNVLETGTLDLGDQTTDIEFVEAYGKIHFIDTPQTIGRIMAVALLLILPLFFFLVKTLRQFVRNVRLGKVFESANISLLKQFAYGLLVMWIIMIVHSQVIRYKLIDRMEFDQIVFTGEARSYSFMLLLALFSWVIGHIFLKGKQMKEELDLTV